MGLRAEEAEREIGASGPRISKIMPSEAKEEGRQESIALGHCGRRGRGCRGRGIMPKWVPSTPTDRQLDASGCPTGRFDQNPQPISFLACEVFSILQDV